MSRRRSETRREISGVASPLNAATKSATPLTTPTLISATSSTSAEALIPSSSLEGRNVKKQKLTVQPPTIDYPTIASGACTNAAISIPHLRLRRNNQVTMQSQLKNILFASYTPNVSYTPRQSTRASNASHCAKPWEHHLLPPTRAPMYSEDVISTIAPTSFSSIARAVLVSPHIIGWAASHMYRVEEVFAVTRVDIHSLCSIGWAMNHRFRLLGSCSQPL